MRGLLFLQPFQFRYFAQQAFFIEMRHPSACETRGACYAVVFCIFDDGCGAMKVQQHAEGKAERWFVIVHAPVPFHGRKGSGLR